MITGLTKAIILLSGGALDWSKERLAIVLRHKLAHIVRWDLFSQLLADCGTAIWWYQPLFWYASRRLQVEREFARDDLVLQTGTPGAITQTNLEAGFLDGRFDVRAIECGTPNPVDPRSEHESAQPRPLGQSWRLVGKVQPKDAGPIDPGNLEVKPAYKPPTIGSRRPLLTKRLRSSGMSHPFRTSTFPPADRAVIRRPQGR